VLSLSGRELRKIRGARFSVIYQDSTVLNPVIRIGNQLVEILRAHYDWSLKQCREKAIALLEDVELQNVGRVFASFPHQLSGGQRQRVVIAQALACRPVFVIADEPTASLDSATAGEILDLLGRLKKSYLTSFLLISHDLIPLEYLADRIMVMYAGRIVEQGPAAQVMQNPLHPYTQALLACDLSRMRANPESVARIPMPTIPGDPPDLTLAVSGCRFECRCQSRMSVCRGLFPKEVEPAADHTVQCFMFGG
jgi:peptide/nickel transport system ATP-binding protein/oligopeptide transport system ATP-binding protein